MRRLSALPLVTLAGCHLLFGHAPPSLGDAARDGGGAGDGAEDAVVDLALDPRIARVSVGSAHTCALLRDGGVRCWGWNDWGMLGDGGILSSARPVVVAGLPPAQAVAAGMVHTCALAGGAVYCWGYGGWKQLGQGAAHTQAKPHLMPATDGKGQSLSPAVEVVTGHQHTCRRGADGLVHCLGMNDFGQLGDSSRSSATALVQVGGLNDCKVEQIAAGLHHTCARCNTEVHCWGRNDLGQIGDGTSTDALKARQVARTNGPLSGVTEIWAGGHAACARLADGSVVCWGDNHDGQLTGAAGVRTLAAALEWPSAPKQPVSELALGLRHTCALAGRRVHCWGNNLLGALGSGAQAGAAAPQEVPGLAEVRRVAAGGSTSCALLDEGVYCWGHNGRGQVGNGLDGAEPAPRPVYLSGPLQTPLLAIEIDAGERHTCAVTKDHQVYCWGRGSSGELGAPRILEPAPFEIQRAGGSFESATTVTAGYGHTCVLENGVVQCWGQNQHGELGIGKTTAWELPSPMRDAAQKALVGVKQIAAGHQHTCLIDAEDRIRCTGNNGHGQIGIDPATTSSVSSPSLGPGGALALTSGDQSVCARFGDELRCWGSNLSGVLGIGDESDRFSPTKLGLKGKAREPFAVGRSHACAQHDEGGLKLTCWGSGSHGQLGTGGTSGTLSPGLPVSGLGALLDLDASPGMDLTGAHSCAVDTSYQLWCWGWNGWGQLGTGARSDAKQPARVSGLAKAIKVTTGAQHSCAITDNSQVFCWGYNGEGQVGIGTLPIEVKPVRVEKL